MKNPILLRIIERRKELKMTQEDLGELLKMPRGTYRDIENGKTSLKLEVFLEICKKLQLDPSSLVKDTDDIIITLSREQIDVLDDIHEKIHNQVNINNSYINGDIVIGSRQYKKSTDE